MYRQKAEFYFTAKQTDQKTSGYIGNIRQGIIFTGKRHGFISELN
jgi:hypothetical protein